MVRKLLSDGNVVWTYPTDRRKELEVITYQMLLTLILCSKTRVYVAPCRYLISNDVDLIETPQHQVLF